MTQRFSSRTGGVPPQRPPPRLHTQPPLSGSECPEPALSGPSAAPASAGHRLLPARLHFRRSQAATRSHRRRRLAHTGSPRGAHAHRPHRHAMPRAPPTGARLRGPLAKNPQAPLQPVQQARGRHTVPERGTSPARVPTAAGSPSPRPQYSFPRQALVRSGSRAHRALGEVAQGDPGKLLAHERGALTLPIPPASERRLGLGW